MLENIPPAPQSLIPPSSRLRPPSHEDWMRLASLIPVSEEELRNPTPAIRRKVGARLAKALRAERRLGRAGHWSYDLNRHLALKQASRRFGAPPDVA